MLDRDEPNYEEAASQFGPDALPLLRRFVEGGDPNLAAKATYLAGRIGDPEATPILELAANSPEPGIRAAAASGAKHIGMAAESVFLTLLDDDDPAVRKTALRATPPQPSDALRDKIRALRDFESEPALRDVAAEVFDNLPGGGPST
ncbi:HEAT repeat domain-containing protein [Geodermatophilus sp. URMC 62]|uniref:HEAT repeat domain-containing protein n=1 Tax=Geodermatophilus sp. URMC 62 TaxID=3423414 RepID=UPI00406C5BB0